MDRETIGVYNEQFREKIRLYDSRESYFKDVYQFIFQGCKTILDVGFGSGRDVLFLHSKGFEVYGIDPCENFVNSFKTRHPELADRVQLDRAPELTSQEGMQYDGIVLSAILMHFQENEIFDTLFRLKKMLSEEGRVVISLPGQQHEVDPQTKRKPDGRLFNWLPPGKIELLMERLGFFCFYKFESEDTLGRPGITWTTLAFKLEPLAVTRPIDRIESVLNRDLKRATYKLALFRALAEIAQQHPRTARWNKDNRVSVPIDLIIEKWIQYYWPIIGSKKFIPQIQTKELGKGKLIAFRKLLGDLMTIYRHAGGRQAFLKDLRSKALSTGASAVTKSLFSKIRRTLIEGPVKHAGMAGSENQVFGYENGLVFMDEGIWRELSLMGSWIIEGCIIKWGELTHKLSKGTVRPSEVIDLLIEPANPERDVSGVRDIFRKMENRFCVWTNNEISDFEIDHVIPFALWKNNDLWNLLPASHKANSSKKDKLPTNDLLHKRKDAIIYYWDRVYNKRNIQFRIEAQHFLGGPVPISNWENSLFSTLLEAVETTAIQRGIDRWQP